jgi:hypothetical protein
MQVHTVQSSWSSTIQLTRLPTPESIGFDSFRLLTFVSVAAATFLSCGAVIPHLDEKALNTLRCWPGAEQTPGSL